MLEWGGTVPENGGNIDLLIVQRKKWVASGPEGMFHLENGESCFFFDLKSAFEWSVKDPGSMNEFVFPFVGKKLVGTINFDPEKNKEVVMIASGDRMGISPKSRENEYYVCSDGKTFFRIVFMPSVTNEHLFRKDSVYINLEKNVPVPVLHFTYNTGISDFHEALNGMTELLGRIGRIFGNLLDGVYDKPQP